MSMRKFPRHKFPFFTFKVEIASPRCSLFSDVKEVIELVIWTDTVLGVEIMLAISHYFIGKRSKNSLLAEMSTTQLLHTSQAYRRLKKISTKGSSMIGSNQSREYNQTWRRQERKGAKGSFLKATHKFLVFNDQRKRKMRLNCEVSIVNRLGPSFSMRNSSKPARASLAIGRKESSKIAGGTAEKTVFLLVCTAKEKNGARYKVCTTFI